jgi:hypothetical protein
MRLHAVTFLAMATILLTLACGEDANAPPGTATAVAFGIVSGGGQTGIVGQQLPQPVRVLAMDSDSQPVPNVVVNFVVSNGGGRVFAGSVLTNAYGIAADIWRLGTVAGSAQTLEVRAVDAAGNEQVYGTVSATATAGNPTSITALAGDGQSAEVNTAVPLAPTVKLLDRYGNPVPNYPVIFAATVGGGVVAGGQANSDVFGVAAPSSWTLGPVAGNNVLTATASGVPGSPVSFSATGIPAVVLHLAFSTFPPDTVQNGVAIGPAPSVQLLDPQGNPVAKPGIPITATLNGPGGILSGTVVVNTDGTGTATFGGLVITGTLGAYTLSFQGPGMAPLTSSTITLMPGDFWTTLNAPMPTPRRFTAYGVINGVLWVVGGRTNSGVTAVNEGYDVAGGTWISKRALPVRRTAAVGGVINNELYVVGGKDENGVFQNSVYSYNPTTNNWTLRAPIPEAKDFQAAAVINGILYVAGGGQAGSPTLSSTTYAYDPVFDSWSQKASMPMPRGDLVGVALGGLFYVVVGADTLGVDGTLLAYDPAIDSWSIKSPMPTARLHMNADAVGGKLYAIGGLIGVTGVNSNAVEIYDPVTDSWGTAASFTVARNGGATGVIGGKIYFAGGETSSGNTGVTEVYTP